MKRGIYLVMLILVSSCAFAVVNDSTGPTASIVADGLNFIDYDWTSSLDTLYGSWYNATDDSNIFYLYRVVENGSSYPQGPAFVDAQTDQEATVIGLNLSSCSNYAFEVRSRDTFFNPSVLSSSDGIVAEYDAPNVSDLTSSTHPDPSITYLFRDVTFIWNASDFGPCQSGVYGYSWVLDKNNLTIPDNQADVPDGLRLQSMKNDGTSVVLKESGTGSAFSVFSEIKGSVSVGDVLDVTVALVEETAESPDTMKFNVYAMDGTPSQYGETGNAISNIVTRQNDIYYRPVRDATIYKTTLTINQSATDYYIAIAGLDSGDDNNNFNLSIAASSDANASTDAYVCSGGSCDDNSTTLEFAVKVEKRLSTNTSRKTLENVGNGRWFFHVKARDVAGNWGPTEVFNVSVKAEPILVELDTIESPTVADEIDVTGTVDSNQTDNVTLWLNNQEFASSTVTANAFSFSNVPLNMGANSIFVRAYIQGIHLGTSAKWDVLRINETRINVSSLTISHNGYASSSNRLSYGRSGSLPWFGAGTDSSMGVTTSTARGGKLDTAFVFVTDPDVEEDTLKERAEHLLDDSFFHYPTPSLGYDLTKGIDSIAIVLNYEDVYVTGDSQKAQGRHRIKMKNLGKVDGKVNLSISLE